MPSDRRCSVMQNENSQLFVLLNIRQSFKNSNSFDFEELYSYTGIFFPSPLSKDVVLVHFYRRYRQHFWFQGPPVSAKGVPLAWFLAYMGILYVICLWCNLTMLDQLIKQVWLQLQDFLDDPRTVIATLCHFKEYLNIVVRVFASSLGLPAKSR